MAWTKEQFKELYIRRKAELVSRLGGVCVGCGTTENLQFHHKDRATKSHGVLKFINKRAVFAEAEKCVLLCFACHYAEHHTPPQHGEHRMYQHYKCRCEKCKVAGAAYNRAARLRAKLRAMPE